STKTMMVERVSNADRARYALRASPTAHQRKRPDNKQSLFRKGGFHRGWAKTKYRGDRPRSYRTEGSVNLATTGKNSCRSSAKIVDVEQCCVESGITTAGYSKPC